MTKTAKILFSALIGLGTLALTTATAAAAIVCNGSGEHWHSQHTYHYWPEWGLTVHPNNCVGGQEITMFGANTPVEVIGATASGCGSEPAAHVAGKMAA